MKKNLLPLAVAALGAMSALTWAPALRADQPDAAEARLRDMLKNTMLQLRTAQNDLATAQATAAEDDKKIQDLTAQNDTLTKQAIADKDTSEKTVAELNKKNAEQAAQLAAYKDALAKWEAGYKLAATVAKAKEAERAKLNSEKIILQRRVDDLESKNMTLFQIGSEILTRYEKFGLGEALAAKEPFVGTTRVKLENQVQDYQDKLLNQKSSPGSEPAAQPQQPPQQPAPAVPRQSAPPAARPSASPASKPAATQSPAPKSSKQ